MQSDAHGNLWGTYIMLDGIFAIRQEDRSVHIIWFHHPSMMYIKTEDPEVKAEPGVKIEPVGKVCPDIDTDWEILPFEILVDFRQTSQG